MTGHGQPRDLMISSYQCGAAMMVMKHKFLIEVNALTLPLSS